MDSLDPFRIGGLRIWRFQNRIFSSNSYLCATDRADGCFLVDPGTDPEGLEALLEREGLTPQRIFCTHGHFDHTGGAAYFQNKYGIECFMHGGDLPTLRRSNFLMMALKVPYTMQQPRVEEPRDLVMVLGGHELRFLFAPGHTPGSCVLACGPVLFTGDTLYSYGVGLSGVPGQDPELLKASLLSLWEQLPGGAFVCPGHGDSEYFAKIQKFNLPLREFLGLMNSPSGGN